MWSTPQAIVSALAHPQNGFNMAASIVAVGESILFSKLPDYKDDYVLVVAFQNTSNTAVLTERPHVSHTRFPREHLAFKQGIEAMSHVNVATILESVHSNAAIACCDDLCLVIYRRKVLRFCEERMGWKAEDVPYKIAKKVTERFKSTATIDFTVDYCILCNIDTMYLALCDCFAPRRCAGCGQSDAAVLKKCSACRRVRYCSRECQERDWPKHKTACRAEEEEEE